MFSPELYFRIRLENVIKYIPQILKQHQCVIIPDFGGFLINDKPAWYNKETERFFPPSSQIVFNKNLRSNDGLLAQAIVNADEISFSTANQRIREYVLWANNFLKENKSIIIPDIGKVYIDSAGQQQFVQLNNHNFRKESYGLPQIDALLRPIEKELAHIVPITTEENQKRHWLSTAAASMAILFTIGLFYVLNDTSINMQNQQAGIGLPEKTKATEIVKEPPVIDNDTIDPFAKEDAVDPYLQESRTSDNIFEEHETPASEKTDMITTPAVEVEPQKSNYPPIEYTPAVNAITQHIVIGMFIEKANADKMYLKSQNAGFSTQLIIGKKYNRVVIPTTGNRAQIKSQLRQIKKSLEPGAWIWETR